MYCRHQTVVHAERPAAQPGQIRSTDRWNGTPATHCDIIHVANIGLRLANEIKVLGVILDWHLTFEKHVSTVALSCSCHNQAIHHIRHLLITQLAQTLLCSTAFHPATSRTYSVFRTARHGLFCSRQCDLTPSHYYASCTGCLFNIGSRTSWQTLCLVWS